MTLTCQDIQALKPVIVLVGPTAIGKSRVAIEMAKELGTEVLTADSRQVYRGMDIGTDKPTIAERQGIPHQLIDLVDPDQHFNVGDFRRHAVQEIARLHQQGTVPLIAGGTGLYIRAVLRGLWSGPTADWTFRHRLTQEAKEKGEGFLYQELMKVDPQLAKQLHPRDHVKIQRGLEVFHLLGTPLSQSHQRHGFQEILYPSFMVGLTMERESLYKRIEARVELEIAKGLLQETQELLTRGFSRTLRSMTGLGYRQFSGYLAGEYSYDEAVCLLKRDTRHFAKRQMTWFRKEPSIHWQHIDEDEPSGQVANRVLVLFREFLSNLKRSDSVKPPNTVLTPCESSS
ncbi:MAG: tRNA (adenosine(37)-N6)-dimethylallyltransferase MiaA [Nitrospirota bacterium]|nr:MAG: tRNA (adenosine(37)-N6)-dimethylallyltransferase MiaA [Nitrospirota bacterium]